MNIPGFQGIDGGYRKAEKTTENLDHRLGKAEVVSSILTGSTIFPSYP